MGFPTTLPIFKFGIQELTSFKVTSMAANLRRLGRLVPSSSVLFVCDIQEAFRKGIYQLPTVIQGTNTLVAAAKTLDVPIVVTTQYAARLGDTVNEIASNLEDAKNVKTFDKMLFSMMTPEVTQHVEALPSQPKSVILCGIEGHVCVLQTCLDLLEKGYDVHVVSDAISSSTAFNRSISLERMRQSGAFITSVESSIFQLAGDASHPSFRSISKLIKEHLKVDNAFDTVTPKL
ncbi:hypothetical protein Poli38472_000242 [Pythium oligandrum]|uniref:Isochorismatase-like domain-containing protein n=1 Tax=Pythium oligandrum TaxID=41045 RepID=A0A8K1CCB9_PYTOL|nr:hypothetical protein Poli38472_000242 [Pythium oligandrum]|eukprot:TMW60200.1 hypothetical protein Poli38472_000242 [Pythium oligandrum]